MAILSSTHSHQLFNYQLLNFGISCISLILVHSELFSSHIVYDSSTTSLRKIQCDRTVVTAPENNNYQITNIIMFR